MPDKLKPVGDLWLGLVRDVEARLAHCFAEIEELISGEDEEKFSVIGFKEESVLQVIKRFSTMLEVGRSLQASRSRHVISRPLRRNYN